MTLRDDLLPVLQDARQIVDDLGLRQVRVFVRTRTWSSGKIQTGTATVATIEIWPRPKVVGQSGDPVLQVGPITPRHFVGGYTPAMINPSDAPGMEWFYVVLGPDGISRPYKLMQLTTPRPFRYMLGLTALDRKVPF